MIDFAYPSLLLLGVPWLGLVSCFHWTQSRALAGLAGKIAPRFLGVFTNYNRGLLAAHSSLLLGMGWLLVCATAHPGRLGKLIESNQFKSVVIVMDCSFSMTVKDAAKYQISGIPPLPERREQAAALARAVIEHFPDVRFGLVSFSGAAVVHSPPTQERKTILAYLEQPMESHHGQTGTDFKAALGAVVHLVERSPDTGLQALLFSDGEAINCGDYTDELAVLKHQGVRVHCVGIGTLKGATMRIGDVFTTRETKVVGDKLVTADVEDVRNVKESQTCRVDEDLKRICRSTGGAYVVPETGGTLQDLFKALERAPAKAVRVARAGRQDMSGPFLFAFAVLFLADVLLFDGFRFWSTLWINRRRFS